MAAGKAGSIALEVAPVALSAADIAQRDVHYRGWRGLIYSRLAFALILYSVFIVVRIRQSIESGNSRNTNAWYVPGAPYEWIPITGEEVLERLERARIAAAGHQPPLDDIDVPF